MDESSEPQFAASNAEPLQSRECTRCDRRFGEAARFCPFDGEPLRSVQELHSDPLVGCVVDNRYRVLGVLGEGGMGTVYKVVHRSLRRQFALKALRVDLAREPDLAERFLREARSAAAISHPNVCEITDFGYLPDGRPYFAMELLTGRPLSWWLRKGGPIPVNPAIRIIEQLGAALELAHVAGIVHRDLKPENIVVSDATTEVNTKVVDFGLAQIAGQSRLTRRGVVYGTPHYMSPEQASGGDVDHRADIYALGVVMYEMFTGRVPFEADTYMGVLTKHMYVAPTPLSDVSGGAKELGAIEDIVLRCLQKRPERRYQRMVDLVAALRSVVSRSEDGAPRVRPRRLAPENRHGLPLLANEVEPPTRSELIRELARLERNGGSRASWLFVGAAGVVLGGAGWSYLAGGASDRPTREIVPARNVASVALPARAAAQQPLSVARPDPVPAAATTGETAAESPAKPEVSRRRRAARPARLAQPSASKVVQEPAPVKPDFGTSDIVDPWSN